MPNSWAEAVTAASIRCWAPAPPHGRLPPDQLTGAMPTVEGDALLTFIDPLLRAAAPLGGLFDLLTDQLECLGTVHTEHLALLQLGGPELCARCAAAVRQLGGQYSTSVNAESTSAPAELYV
jgi:hypothetical protein